MVCLKSPRFFFHSFVVNTISLLTPLLKFQILTCLNWVCMAVTLLSVLWVKLEKRLLWYTYVIVWQVVNIRLRNESTELECVFCLWWPSRSTLASNHCPKSSTFQVGCITGPAWKHEPKSFVLFQPCLVEVQTCFQWKYLAIRWKKNSFAMLVPADMSCDHCFVLTVLLYTVLLFERNQILANKHGIYCSYGGLFQWCK